MFYKNFYFNHQTYFYIFEKFKFFIKTLKNSEKINFSILKVTVTEDFGTDSHPDPLVRGTDQRIRIRIPTYQNVRDPKHWKKHRKAGLYKVQIYP